MLLPIGRDRSKQAKELLGLSSQSFQRHSGGTLHKHAARGGEIRTLGLDWRIQMPLQRRVSALTPLLITVR